MLLIVGLGNPGNQYTDTRHNTGFQVLDAVADHLKCSFKSKTKFFGELAECMVGGQKIALLKPSTFYNESGKAVRAVAEFYKLPPKDILVLHDELALPLGAVRVRERGSDAGNNGIKSVTTHIGENYWRLRIGVNTDRHPGVNDADYVLGSFSAKEIAALEKNVYPEIEQLIKAFIRNTLKPTSISTQ